MRRRAPRIGFRQSISTSTVAMSFTEDIFALTPAIRYMAYAASQHVDLHSRPDRTDPSAPESDRYEELLVNPTLLTLAKQRGDIDLDPCGMA